MSDITNAINAGKIVITHSDAVSVPGWTGAGYIVLDPIVGDGAYMIGTKTQIFYGAYVKQIKQSLNKALFWAGSILSLLESNKTLSLLADTLGAALGVLISTIQNLITLVTKCDNIPMIAMVLMGFVIANLLLELSLIATCPPQKIYTTID